MRVFTLASALLLSATPLLAQESARHDHAPGAHAGERIGTVSFPNSGAATAFVAALLGDTARARSVAESLPERAVITRGHVAALLARARADTANWIASLAAAANADTMVVHLGPPNVYPAHELLGDALLAVGRAKEAVAAYETRL